MLLMMDSNRYNITIKGMAVSQKHINRAADRARNKYLILLSLQPKFLNFKANRGISETRRREKRTIRPRMINLFISTDIKGAKLSSTTPCGGFQFCLTGLASSISPPDQKSLK